MDNKITVLNVDDDRIMRLIVEEALKDQGYNLLFAKNGKEGYK